LPQILRLLAHCVWRSTVEEGCHIDKKAILHDLISMPSVEMVHELDYFRLLAFWPEKCPDYGDAVLLAFCKGSSEVRLATFDRTFIRIAQEVGVKLYENVES
jgi:predicted nucleic acid-binding protein